MKTTLISDNIKVYVPYFKWNEALVNHYFGKRNNGEILLYIDNKVLEELGEKNCIESNEDNSYETSFKNAVLNFCKTFYNTKNILRAALQMNEDNKFYAMTPNRKIEITHDNKPRIYSIPYFSIILYVILVFDDQKNGTQQWKNVHDALNLGHRETLDHSAIKILWHSLHLFNDKFDENASVYEREEDERNDYVGKIKYHLPLSSSTNNKIKDAIYKSSAWKLVGTRSYWEIVGFIIHSLKDTKANQELNNILLNCYSAKDYKGISIRKVQSVIEEFDIDAYEERIAERRNSTDYSQTIVSGTFALAIYFPEDNSNEDNSIVLLTTVQQSVNINGFFISEGKSGTLAGYNTSKVRVNNSTSVELKDYALKNSDYRILPLKCDNVVFFYEYDENLYIQTREIKPAKSFFIAVKNDSRPIFETWCIENNNEVKQLSIEDTKELFGANWTIYYTNSRLNGQYYPKTSQDKDLANESTIIIKKGDIYKDKIKDLYFINALPYFEVPEIYDINEVKIYLNLNGREFNDYNTIIVGRKIIIYINGMPIESDEIAYIQICLECNSHNRFVYEFNVCGQPIIYDTDLICKYNNFGMLCNDQHYSFYGNYVKDCYRSKNVRGLFHITKNNFDLITDDLYFTNLLAACCYDSLSSEISNEKFKTCVSYAADRLDIDTQREDFVKNAKQLMIQAGIITIDYEKNKCQAIAPMFMRVPFSVYHAEGTQLIMLCGCYTRSFIADLNDFCRDKNIDIFILKNCVQNNEEALLPPIFLLGHNFCPDDFAKTYHQKCDIMNDYDFALSLINIIPHYNDVKSQFEFRHNDSPQFLSMLDKPKPEYFPRITTMGNKHQKKYYIEKQGNMFADIRKGLYPWASIFCHHEIGSPMVIINRDNSIFVPSSLQLPHYVQRALYLMNLGLPSKEKVFVCDSKNNKYYTNMDKYRLSSQERCKTFADKITCSDNNDSPLVRNMIQTECKMQFWKEINKGKKHSNKYLVLLNKNQDIVAVAYNFNVYLNINNSFRKIDSDSINEVISFIIKKRNWYYNKNSDSIGYSKNSGISFEIAFRLMNEKIEIPQRNQVITETIQIA